MLCRRCFRVRFVTAARESPQDFLDPDLLDEIVFDGQVVDLGALTIEQLALALPPFPRKLDLPDVDVADDPPPDDDTPMTRPFAHLAHLMNRNPEGRLKCTTGADADWMLRQYAFSSHKARFRPLAAFEVVDRPQKAEWVRSNAGRAGDQATRRLRVLNVSARGCAPYYM